jgi:nitrate/nitrite-specific signal transduction histidine kinase
MQEQAEKIGGHFSVRSSAAAGTEVELSVPKVSGLRARQEHDVSGLT